MDRNNRCPVGDSCKVRRDGGGFRGHACGAIGRGAGWRGRLSIYDPGVVRSAAEITTHPGCEASSRPCEVGIPSIVNSC